MNLYFVFYRFSSTLWDFVFFMSKFQEFELSKVKQAQIALVYTCQNPDLAMVFINPEDKAKLQELKNRFNIKEILLAEKELQAPAQ